MTRLLVLLLLLPACESSSESGPDARSGDPDAGPTVDRCAELGLPAHAFEPRGTGTRRGDLVGDLSLPLVDGTHFVLSERWSGCDLYAVVPDSIPRSGLDPAPLWSEDLPALLDASPDNVHYIFVSTLAGEASAQAALAAQAERIEAVLASRSDADSWRDRLHVVAERAGALDGWLPAALAGAGSGGFVIDRGQRLRGVGMLADVWRYDGALEAAGKWPWANNLAYFAHEVSYHNAQAALDEQLASEAATVVELFDAELISSHQADVEVLLPDAATMASFDTLEIEVRQACPRADRGELGNCGAWDYIARLWLVSPDGPFELARFITAYHRETRWLVDASPMLALLRTGGAQTLRWEFAPDFNPQPTTTTIRLRFSARGKGRRPVAAIPLHGGGLFDASFAPNHPPISVAVPADITGAEIYALTTGHGSDSLGCGEFCDHRHELRVGSEVHSLRFPAAGTTAGCVTQVDHGMTPNQGGTWWFGRAGWCPGQQVEPWIVDISPQVEPGEETTIGYEAIYPGTPPTENPGHIEMASYLVFYR